MSAEKTKPNPNQDTLAENELEQKRNEFVKYLIKKAGVIDFKLAHAIQKIDRRGFVPDHLREYCYADSALPLLGDAEKIATISQPSLTIRMIQALNLKDHHKVLELGTGTGFSTALTSLLCDRVTTIEINRDLAVRAQERFQKLGLNNIELINGDGANGWSKSKPYDRIISTAAFKQIPTQLISQLTENGIILAPVGEDIFNLSLILGKKIGDGIVTMEIGSVQFVPIITNQIEVGWTREQALAMLEQQSRDEKNISLSDIAKELGFSDIEYRSLVLAVFGYLQSVPNDSVEGLAQWIVTLRMGVDKEHLVGDF